MIALKTHIITFEGTAGTPEPIIDRLHREAVRFLSLPGLRQKFDELVLETIGSSPAEFAADIQAEILRWTPARPQLR